MNLSLLEYNWIGFDMDHTLVKYIRKEFYMLLHSAFSKFLVDEKGYDKVLLERKFNENFCKKGHVVDIETGDIISISSEGEIIEAYHGMYTMVLSLSLSLSLLLS